MSPSRYTVGTAGASVGSSPQADIQVKDDDLPIEPRHAEIQYVDRTFSLLSQAPGLSLNGAAPLVPGSRQPIKAGDRIRLGRHELQLQSSQDGAAEALARLLPAFTPIAGRAAIPSRDGLAEILDEWQLDTPAAPDPLAAASPVDGGLAKPSRQSDRDATSLAAIVSGLRQGPIPAPPVSSMTIDQIVAGLPQERPSPHQVEPLSTPGPPSAAEPVAEPAGVPAAPATGGEGLSAGGSQVAIRLLSGSDDAAAALAAFWWNLGMLPPGKGSGELFQLMGELGRTLRELVSGLATVSKARGQAPDPTDSNPLFGGVAGLQRMLESGGSRELPLSAWVGQYFETIAKQDQAAADRVGAAAHNLAQSLGARAVEEKIRPLANNSWRSRSSQYWRLFRLLSDDMGKMAELHFHQEVDDSLRGTQRSTAQRGATNPAPPRWPPQKAALP